MTFLNSALSHLSFKHSKVYSMPLSAWSRDVSGMPTRQIEKVELCSGMTLGKNERGHSVHDYDIHTFLRAFLAPTAHAPREVVLIERVKSFEGAYHSVVPVSDIPPSFHNEPGLPDILDRIHITRYGSFTDIVHNLEVERTLELNSPMTVQELAMILQFISSSWTLVCSGAKCTDLARSFAITCLTALSPLLPPVSKQCVEKSRTRSVNTAVREATLEDAAKMFLDQFAYMLRDPQPAPAFLLIQQKRQVLCY